LVRSVDGLNKTAEELYEYVRRGDLEAAHARAGLFSRQLAEARWMERTTMEGVEAPVSAVVQLKRALAAVTPDLQRIEFHAVRIRLATDALKTSGEPMWRQYERVVMD